MEEKYKDYALLMSTSYEEMEMLAQGNKEREAVVAFVKRLGVDKMFIDESIKREYERVDAELTKKEAVTQVFEEGYGKGIEQGKEENKIEMIKSMYTNKVSIKVIAKSAKISIKDVENILKFDNI